MKKKLFEYKIKNRYLVYFILAGYLLGSLLGLYVHNASAISVTESIGFEEGVLTHEYNNAFFSTKTMSGTSTIENTPVRSGTRSYKIQRPGSGGYIGYWNLTYDNPYLTSFSCYFRSYEQLLTMSFYNKTLGISTPIIKLSIQNGGSGTHIALYYDYLNVAHTLNVQTYSVWNYVGFVIIDNQTVDYYNTSTNVKYRDTPRSILTGAQQPYFHIDTIKFSGGNYFTTDNTVFDDMNFTFSDTFSGVTATGCTDTSSYYKRGLLYTGYSTDVRSKSLYENMVYPMTTSIRGVALCVNPSQYDDDPNPDNYTLTLNGIKYTGADCFYLDTTGGYVLFWDINIGIVNSTTSLNFTHNKKTYNRYWVVCNGGSSLDLDNDGEITSGVNEFLRTDCKWTWINYIPFYICKDIWKTTNNFDLSYQIYFTQPITINQYNYTDTLGLTNYETKNSTGYIYNINSPGIFGSYTLGTSAYSYQLYIWKNGSYWNTTGYPLSCTYPSGSFGLTPNTIGKYQFKLKRTGWVDNITAYVYGVKSNFYISTNPPITNQYDNYNVTYNYRHEQGFKGYIGLFNTYENVNDYSKAIYQTYIGNNISGQFTYSSTSSSTEYWRLFISPNNASYTPVGDVATHYIRIPGVLDNTISFSPSTLTISPNNPENRSVIIKGTHNMLGADVGIYVNGAFYTTVKTDGPFTKYFYPKTAVPKTYTIDLRVKQDNNELIILATSPQQLTVNIEGYPDETPEENPLSFIQPPYSYFAGILIILVFTLTPMIIGKMTGATLHVPEFLYLIMAVVGFVVTIVFEFFPVWSIFVLVLIGILIIVIMWLRNKT